MQEVTQSIVPGDAAQAAGECQFPIAGSNGEEYPAPAPCLEENAQGSACCRNFPALAIRAMDRPGMRFLFELPPILFGSEADAAAAIYCEPEAETAGDSGEIRFLLYRGRDLSILMLEECEVPEHVGAFAWSYARVLSLIDEPSGCCQ